MKFVTWVFVAKVKNFLIVKVEKITFAEVLFVLNTHNQ